MSRMGVFLHEDFADRDIRSANRLTIIKHILNKKHISWPEFLEEMGLNKAKVSTIVKEWMSLKLVEETTTGDSSGGRKPIILTLAARAGYCIAVTWASSPEADPDGLK